MTESRKREAEEDVDILLHLQKHGDFGFPLTDNNIKAIILVSRLPFDSIFTKYCLLPQNKIKPNQYDFLVD